MTLNKTIKRILVIGSGPIVIGQAAEFDYAGTQACLSLREEGYEVVLINSNPATIMTDAEIADKVYIEPLTKDFVIQILKKERIDAILPNLGGQTGLNLAVELYESKVLEDLNIQLLGTSVEAIKKAEDRELFKQLMTELQEPIPESGIVHSLSQALATAETIGYPVIVRPAYTLGGTGGGRCENAEVLTSIVEQGLMLSPVHQCLIEQDISGFKEIEYEVIRDHQDNALIVCTMENFDPVGIHTGDSIVFAPALTLTDVEIQMLRDSALKIIRALGIEGGCNVQFALDPNSYQYYVIEVNPRVSRSSALASKATGYPIAKITAKIAVGLTLKEMLNPVTQSTKALFEPSIDYIVTKIPRWPFDKFVHGDRRLGTQMKATGEVMALGRTFAESLLKAVRSLELGLDHLDLPLMRHWSDDQLIQELVKPTDQRLFAVAEALRRNFLIEDLFILTKIDRLFLNELQHIIQLEQNLSDDNLLIAKQYGFSDSYLASRGFKHHLKPVYKMVDTCAGEFDSVTPYFYSTYDQENESVVSDRQKVVVLGSGPIRIGQGVEFDYATVHCVKAIQAMGYEAIIINNNPETVSTDFELADKLYFEPLTLEDVLHVCTLEQPLGVVVQFGGQTAINLAEGIEAAGFHILGTSLQDINIAEDRKLFEQKMHDLGILQPQGSSASDPETLCQIAATIGYPVLIRPSFVLGGQSMRIIDNETTLRHHLKTLSFQHPVLIDRYVFGTEAEVDAICDGETVLIPGIMEHIEKSGVHSGDSMAIYPAQSLSDHVIKEIERITIACAQGLNTIGLMNIQFIIQDEQVYVIEVNPRASRTVPFLSKVTGIPMAQRATEAMLGKKLNTTSGLAPISAGYHVKAPVFSFAKLRRVDTYLSPEMKSTGEVMGSDETLDKALYKAFIASGHHFNMNGKVLLTVADEHKPAALFLAKQLTHLGFELIATENTAKYLTNHGLPVLTIAKVSDQKPNIIDLMHTKNINFIINTVSGQSDAMTDGFLIRRIAVEQGIPLFTSLDTAQILIQVFQSQIMVPWEMEAHR